MTGRAMLREIWRRTVSLVSECMGDDRRTSAYQRGLELLKGNLTSTQLKQFLACRCFEVVGGESGRTYRITLAGPMNVEELNKEGRCVGRLCFLPEGHLVDGDIMLAQKVALEAFEAEVLAIANKFSNQRMHWALIPTR